MSEKKRKVRGFGKISLLDIIHNREDLYDGNLVDYFQTAFFRFTNLNNPYHNFRHMMHVFWLVYLACRYYKEELTKREIRNLLIAAIFHDADHSGKAGDDSKQIERALKALDNNLHPVDRPCHKEIERLIVSTQYPHCIDFRDVTLSHHILRDADMAQGLDDVWLQQIIFGLGKEMEWRPLSMLRNQLEFIPTSIFRTSWAERSLEDYGKRDWR